MAFAIERPTDVFPTPGGPTKSKIEPLQSPFSLRTARYSIMRFFTSSSPKWSFSRIFLARIKS